ncbi:hypothetical protein K470DRAFT_269974 [Piedraia hortae CBS 480.64]|uniref:Uncharacterized protein n=1 Tax=Piedraia hortae CBS 480.64 TaxID=1314780 RepID=A0A6A7C3S1_9PEZI|nr:hypothetical protein K470DRAFT_269974 [Piedraia hortae CBS 480.64]
MGLSGRKLPLPAPTESMDDDTATNLTSRSTFEIPEDGRPLTVSTRGLAPKDARPGHRRQKSQTSLLIEYFEAAKTGDKAKSRPSVRVRVSPSSKKSRHDAVQVTSIGKDRKPSYTRRISLGGNRNVDVESAQLSHSSESNLSGRPPVEIEFLNNPSEVSTGKSSRGLLYAPTESNVSSMPPDSILDGSLVSERSRSFVGGKSPSHVEAKRSSYTEAKSMPSSVENQVGDAHMLKAPVDDRGRSTSRDRVTQKVMEKLAQSSGKATSSEQRYEQDVDAEGYPIKNHSWRKSHGDSEAFTNGSQVSAASQKSHASENQRLLRLVEDTIKRDILPEISAIKDEKQAPKAMLPEEGKRSQAVLTEEGKRSRKSSSYGNLSKPKVVLNKDGDDPGTVLSRGDSERKGDSERRKSRKSSKGSYEERPSSRRSSARHASGHSLRDDVAAAGLATAALKHHDSRESTRKHNRSRTSSHGESVETLGRTKEIPPMPMASAINESEVTRGSIISSSSGLEQTVRSPIREVSRKTVGEALSPASSRTPLNSPGRALGMSHPNYLVESPSSAISQKAQMAALTAAGLDAPVTKGDAHVNADGYGFPMATPSQSVSSLKQRYENDPLMPQSGPKTPRSLAAPSRDSIRSPRSSPTTQRLAQSRQQSLEPAFAREGTPGTPQGNVDEWYEKQHELNDHYRHSMEHSTNRDSYLTNPYPEDGHDFVSPGPSPMFQDIKGLTANPVFGMHAAVESNVASLIEPSNLSSNLHSPADSPNKVQGSFADRARELGQGSPGSYEDISQDRWASISKHARTLSDSPVKSVGDEVPVMSSSPLAASTRPDMGYIDERSEKSSKRSAQGIVKRAAESRSNTPTVQADDRSEGASTPRAKYSKDDMAEYHRAMNVSSPPGLRTKPLSADISPSKSSEKIASQDIVALMDHLTVRDAQRNARDTEILVTLVRSATEMRQSFDEMKRFIVEQDRLIMQNTDRDAEQTVQKVLGGPRPQPTGVRTPRQDSQEDIRVKRRGVLRRALKGLTAGGKKSDDLARIEDLLMQILDNVEDLKQGTGSERGGSRQSVESDYRQPPMQMPMSSRLPPSARPAPILAPDKMYDRQFHSGYDGRRDSPSRISTVAEGDEEELTPDEDRLLRNQAGFNDRLLTPTQENYRYSQHSANYRGVPEDASHHRQKSSESSAPKVSRWSKTTTSSDPYNMPDGARSNPSLAESIPRDDVRSQASGIARTPSPLIPSEVSYRYEDDELSPASPGELTLDDPKYQSVRNSLQLQHPQPRQGSTGRHQNTLEHRAQDYDDPSTITTTTGSDLSQTTTSDFDPATWGSSGTAALARTRVPPTEPMDQEPLVPPKPDPVEEFEPQYSNSGFSKGGYYGSPFGSGHLLEPIQEVSPEPSLVDVATSRKVAGPRPAPTGSGTLRRKPIGM